ncbi:MAG: type I-E CRISPR-associated protein Cse1/CasA [Terriglobia bacterium]
MNYNLLNEKWIPVLYTNGAFDRVGILPALTEAHQIRDIALASPLDFFAVHRLMLTLLYWKASSGEGWNRFGNR